MFHPKAMSSIFKCSITALIWTLGLSSTSAFAANKIAFVRATSTSTPSISPYQLLDGQKGTVWCSQPEARDNALRIDFNSEQTIQELKVQFVLDKDGQVDESHQRPKFIAISDSASVREVRVRNQSKAQFIKLNPPIRSKSIVITFPNLRPGSSDEAALCLDEVQPISPSGPLGGKGMMKQLKSLTPAEQSFLGHWVDDVSAPEKTFFFHLGRKVKFTYAPLIEGKPVTHLGSWSVKGDQMSLRSKRKNIKIDARLTRTDNGLEQIQQLSVVSPDKAYGYFSATFEPEPISR